MGFKSLSGTTGYLSVTTTPVRLTANLSPTTVPRADAAGAKVSAHTIFVEHVIGNDEPLYLLDRQSGNPATGVGVLKTLVAPFSVSGDLTGLAWVAVTVPYAPGGLNASDYWLVAGAGTQLATVSIIQA